MNVLDPVEIVWLQGERAKYVQVYNYGVEFCLASTKNEQSNHLAFCKDYLQDVFFSTLNNQRVDIYGLNWHPSEYPNPDMENLRIILTEKGAGITKKAMASLEFVNYFEKKFKIKRSSISIINNPPKDYKEAVLFIASSIWFHAPPLLSLYSLLLRIGLSHTQGEDPQETYNKILSGKLKLKNEKDFGMIKQCDDLIKDIIRLGYRKFFYVDPKRNYPSDQNSHSIHNYSGISALANNISNENDAIVKYWSRKKVSKKQKVS